VRSQLKREHDTYLFYYYGTSPFQGVNKTTILGGSRVTSATGTDSKRISRRKKRKKGGKMVL